MLVTFTPPRLTNQILCRKPKVRPPANKLRPNWTSGADGLALKKAQGMFGRSGRSVGNGEEPQNWPWISADENVKQNYSTEQFQAGIGQLAVL
jgi:hypothetical protein